jgi:hypothetical protein
VLRGKTILAHAQRLCYTRFGVEFVGVMRWSIG